MSLKVFGFYEDYAVVYKCNMCFQYEIELKNIITWRTASIIESKRRSPDYVLKLKYIRRDFIYLGVGTLEYIIILINIHNSDKIFERCFTSLTKPKDDKIKIPMKFTILVIIPFKL